MDSHKITIIGDVGVGKTSILKRLVNDKYDENELTTIGIGFNATWINNRKLQFWDTAGEERFRSISRLYYNGAKLIIIVFDVHDWIKIYKWIDEAEELSESPIVLMGNKCFDDSDYDYSDILIICKKIAKEKGYPLYMVNAKNGINIKESFINISERFPETIVEESSEFKLTEKKISDCCIIS